jgi:hypothetical protein
LLIVPYYGFYNYTLLGYSFLKRRRIVPIGLYL